MKESSPTVPPDPQIAALECAHSLMKQIEEGNKNLMELARAIASQIDSRQFIVKSKEFRKEADDLLQRMKANKKEFSSQPRDHAIALLDEGEAIAQLTLSIRNLESCIMRQGMALKYIGATPIRILSPKNPDNAIVHPTADNLKL